MSYPWADIAAGCVERFTGYVLVSDQPPPPNCEGPCHLWQGARSRGQGNKAWYGSFRVGRYVVRTHIFVCVVAGTMIPGHHVDHLCRNTLCVNRDHLEVVTPTENALRRWAATRAANSNIPDQKAA